MKADRAETLWQQILSISTYKGSTSVLADYLFSTHSYDRQEMEFYLKFGFVLQLVDDLQDVKADQLQGSLTLMTLARGEGRLESYVNKLLWLTQDVISHFTPKNQRIHSFVLKNCLEITLLAVAQNADLFSGQYLRQVEVYLPFSVDYLQRMQRKGSLVSADRMKQPDWKERMDVFLE